MSDIATLWIDQGGDWLVDGPSLATDDGLKTAVVLSLFTDRLAESGDVLPDAGASGSDGAGRRGWWGDAYADQPGDLVGSRLWLLDREKVRTQVLRRAEEYTAEALQWLVADGVASAVNVTAELMAAPAPRGTLGLQVVVTRSARPVARFRFETFWKGA